MTLPLLVVVAACTSSGGEPSSPSSSSASTSSAEASTAVVPPAPRPGACYRLTEEMLTRPTSSARSVPCTSRHTARTIFVGRLDTLVDGHSLSVDSDRVQRQLSTTCPRKVDAFVGGSAKSRDLSRFNVVWYSPTLDQAEQGASWFRCDLIAFGVDGRPGVLPDRGLRGALDKPSGLARFGLCGSAAPGTAGFHRVICAKRHAWRAFDTVALHGGKRYPGTTRVRTAGDAVCKGLARARSSNSLKFQYGWEWPTRSQWLGGQHYGYCWAPD